jgi:hypothetical protein
VTGAEAQRGFADEQRYGFGGTSEEWGADKNPAREAASVWRNRGPNEAERRIGLGRDAEAWCARHDVRLGDVKAPLLGRPKGGDPRGLKRDLAVYLVEICGATEAEAGRIAGMAQQNVSKALRKKRV